MLDTLQGIKDRFAYLEELVWVLLGRPHGGGSVTSVTATPPIASSGGVTPNISHLASGVAGPGPYTNATITVDADGHVTAAASGAAPVTTVAATYPLASTGGVTPTIAPAAGWTLTFQAADAASLTAKSVTGIPNGAQGYTVTYGGARWSLQSTQALVTDTIIAAADGRVWVRMGPSNPYAALLGGDGAGNWYFDPAAGNNETGTGAVGAPLKTWGEIVTRLGTSSPVYPYGQSVTVHMVSSQAANTDPIFFTPRMSGGGQAILFGTVVAGTPFAAGVVTAKNQATNTPLQIATFPSAPGTRILNTTRTSTSWVRSGGSGGTATMEQPVNVITTPNVPAPTENNAWATGDNLVPQTLPLCNLQRWDPVAASQNHGNTLASVGWVQDVEIVSADGTTGGGDTYAHACNAVANVLYGCRIDLRLMVSSITGRGTATYIVDCTVLRATVFSGSAIWFAGSVGSGGGGSLTNQGVCTINGDTGINGPITSIGTLQIQACNATAGITAQQGTALLLAANAVWGSGALFALPGAVVWANGVTFVNAYKSSGALTLGTGTTTGTTYSGAGVMVDGVALSAANIDANGAIYDVKTGARFTAVAA